MKTYLNVKYNEKDEAKKIARDNGTAIRWDAASKKWYFEGESVPECLAKYAYDASSDKTVDTHGAKLYLVWREQYGNKVMYRTDKMVDYTNAGKQKLADYVRDFEETEGCDIQNDPGALFMKTTSFVKEGRCLMPRIHNLMSQQVGEAIKGWTERKEIV